MPTPLRLLPFVASFALWTPATASAQDAGADLRPADAASDAATVADGRPAADDDGALRLVLAEYPFRLLYESCRDGNWELYSCAADGSDSVNLTRTEDIDETYGKVSPDGQWIAFCADCSDDTRRRRDIHLMRIDGSDRTSLVENARDPFWSADSVDIGYLPGEFERFSHVTWATKGLRFFSFVTGETRPHPNAAIEHLYTPSMSADGRWILASVHGGLGFPHAIVAIERDGTAVHDLGLYGCRVDLSADGRSVAWGHGEFSIERADIDLAGDTPKVGEAHSIVHNSRRGPTTYHVDWSPDGRFVAYSSGPRAEGRRLISHRTPEAPGVEADGWDIWIADPTTTNRCVQITFDGESNKEPDWIPLPAGAAEKREGDR